MLQINYIQENPEMVIERLTKRHFAHAEEYVNQVVALNQKRRQTQVERDEISAESNKMSKESGKEIGVLMKAGRKDEAEQLKVKMASLKTKVKELNASLTGYEKELQEILLQIPNLPHANVAKGKNSEDNRVVLQKGEIPSLHEGALPHWDLIKVLDIIDFELGNKVTGAGFPFYKGKGARLQRALVNFFLDEAVKEGYQEVQPPLLINEASGFGTGQLPDKEGQMYHATVDDFYLIPTAEVPITNMYRDVILHEKDFPIKNVGYTPCFRREAGSWGADVRGLNRLHQFDKVEIVQLQHPDKSYETLEEMKNYVVGLLEKLELPYRVLNLCGGDLGFTSAFTYDMEVYSTAQERWLEVSSVSNFESYQSNRLQLRFKGEEKKKTQLLHTLNGSALALPRILAAILENNQTPEKRINIPKVLHTYTGFDIL